MAAALPELFTRRMRALLGEEEFAAFAASYDQGRRYGLRVNTAKLSPEEFERISPFHLRPVPWIPGGYYYLEEDRAARHPHYFAGLYYLQEPSAMTPASVLDVHPGQKVLDLCAAPGGKATALGAALRGEGLLVANDISASRAKALLKNIEVFGITNSYVTNASPEKLSSLFPEYFDRILVDAPCSGEGMFRKDEAVIRAWYPEKPAECAKLQKDILLRAAGMLCPGGRLLYSTCTFSPLENEEVVLHLLREHPDMRLLSIPHREGFSPGLKQYGEEAERCVRLWPHRIEGEGHFLALFEKAWEPDVEKAVKAWNPWDLPKPAKAEGAGAPETARTVKAKETGKKAADRGNKNRGNKGKLKQERQILKEFFDQLGCASFPSQRAEVRSGQAYLSALPAAEAYGIAFLRNGLYLGEIRKDRFEPSQSLAMMLRPEEVESRLDFVSSDSRLISYLRGETLTFTQEELSELSGKKSTVKQKGWTLICADGYSLGWGKLTGLLLKNKYHSGWRMT